jgi:hypothetical protein
MELKDSLESWRVRLFLARKQLGGDPLLSVRWQRDVLEEVEAALKLFPERSTLLEPMLLQAQAGLRDGERACEAFQSAARARGESSRGVERRAARAVAAKRWS